jgi:hypothetical protein
MDTHQRSPYGIPDFVHAQALENLALFCLLMSEGTQDVHHTTKIATVETFGQIIWGVKEWDDALNRKKTRAANDNQERLGNETVTSTQLLQERGMEMLDQVIVDLNRYQRSKDLGGILEDIKQRFNAGLVREDVEMDDSQSSSMIMPAELTNNKLNGLSMAWQLILFRRIESSTHHKAQQNRNVCSDILGSRTLGGSKSALESGDGERAKTAATDGRSEPTARQPRGHISRIDARIWNVEAQPDNRDSKRLSWRCGSRRDLGRESRPLYGRRSEARRHGSRIR